MITPYESGYETAYCCPLCARLGVGPTISARVLLGVAAFPLMVVVLALAAALDAILRLHRRLR